MPEENLTSQTKPDTPTPPQRYINWIKVLIISGVAIILLVLAFLFYLSFAGLNIFENQESKTQTTARPKTATESAKDSTTATPAATKDETAGWKEYNYPYNEYKFSIKYPGYFELIEPQPSNQRFFQKDEKLFPLYSLTIQNPANSDSDLTEYEKNSIREWTWQGTPKEETIQFVGKSAWKISGKLRDVVSPSVSIEEKSQVLFAVVILFQPPVKYDSPMLILYKDDLKGKCATTFEKMLSTFKFLD